jgi:hypothetical protein
MPTISMSGRWEAVNAEIKPSPQPTSRTRTPRGASCANQPERTRTRRPKTSLSCRRPAYWVEDVGKTNGLSMSALDDLTLSDQLYQEAGGDSAAAARKRVQILAQMTIAYKRIN